MILEIDHSGHAIEVPGVPLLQWMACEPSVEVALVDVLSERIIFNANRSQLITVYRTAVKQWIRPTASSREVTIGVKGGHVIVGDESFTMARDQSLSKDFPNLAVIELGEDGTRLLQNGIPAPDGRLEYGGLSGRIPDVVARITREMDKCER